MIRGEKVILRPVRRTDLEFLQTSYNDEFNDFGLASEGRQEEQFAHDGLLNPDFATLMVTTIDEQVVGSVDYHNAHYGPRGISKAYNIGISLAPEYRGKGYGVEAQRLLAQYLFATYPIMRVEASTDVENRAEQRALEKAGFIRDGIIRGAQWRNGAWHDLVLYSKLRGE